MNRQNRRAAERAARRSLDRKVLALGSTAVLATAGAGAAVVLSSAPAGANATLVVDSLTDDGTGLTLREAIEQANTDPGLDEITFSVTGTITVASDLPAITDALHIHGPGATSMTVDGDDSYALFVFDHVYTAAGTNELSDLTVTGGKSTVGGGAVQLDHGDADTTISNAVLTGNYTSDDGGAVNVYYHSGTVTLDHVTMSDNEAAQIGGALYITGGGDITVTDSVLYGNHGYYAGGAFVWQSSLTITRSEISHNEAGKGAGGIDVSSGADLAVVDSTIFYNSAGLGKGGGVLASNAGAISITGSTIADNSSNEEGAGLFIDDSASFRMTNSTVSGNAASASYGYGGGIYLDMEDAVITQSTISGNVAQQAGGIFVGDNGGLLLQLSTVTDNEATSPYSGPAVHGIQLDYYAGYGVVPAGTLELVGSIVAGNGNLDVGSYAGDPVTVESTASIIGAVDSPDVTVTDEGGTQEGVTSVELALGPLADNGGPTQTHALLPGSVALDAGPATADLPVFDGSGYDQRGTPYVRVYNGTVDVGAYEAQPEPSPGPGPEPTPEPSPEPNFTG